MAKTAKIILKGRTAELIGGDFYALLDATSAPDPKVLNSPEYRSGQLPEGAEIAHLSTDRVFPRGLVGIVKKAQRQAGFEVVIESDEDPLPELPGAIDKASLLKGIELWPSQIKAIEAMFSRATGHCESSTGSGKTAIALAIAKLAYLHFEHKTLIIAASKGNAYQTVKEAKKFYGEGIDVGFIGDGRKSVSDITIATQQTLASIVAKKLANKPLKDSDEAIWKYLTEDVDRLIADECHRASGAQYYRVCLITSAKQVVGLSGTPLVKRKLRDLRMIAVTGPRRYKLTAAEMVSIGKSAQPKIIMVSDTNIYPPGLPDKLPEDVSEKYKRYSWKLRQYNLAYEAYYTRNKRHNRDMIVASALAFAERKLPTLILCRKLPQFRRLYKILNASGVSFSAVSGTTPIAMRELAKEQLGEGTIRILLASDIFSTGEDMPNIRCLCLAEGVSSFANFMQRIGRGMRKKREGVNEVWVVDSAPSERASQALWRHAAVRYEGYKAAGYKVKVVKRFDPTKLTELFTEEWDDAVAI